MTNDNTTKPNAATQYNVDGEPTASTQALLNKHLLQIELENLPPHGDLATILTTTTPHGEGTYVVIASEDEEERAAFLATIAAQMEAEGTIAAAVTSVGVSRATGGESVVVMASDRRGAEEAWTARVVRDGVNSPTLTEWQQVDMRGRFMFMLHVGVGNNAGICRLARCDGVPPEYARPR